MRWYLGQCDSIDDKSYFSKGALTLANPSAMLSAKTLATFAKDVHAA